MSIFSKPKYETRKLFIYDCIGCGKKRRTFLNQVLQEMICKICRGRKVDPRQTKLFVD